MVKLTKNELKKQKDAPQALSTLLADTPAQKAAVTDGDPPSGAGVPRVAR